MYLSEFWPLPPPTDWQSFPHSHSLFEESYTLAGVNLSLQQVLAEGMFPDNFWKYYAAPNGFSLATRIEQIDSDGFPETDSDDRWNVPKNIKKGFSFGSILDWFSFAPPSIYRIFVFVVTDHELDLSGAPLSQSEAGELFHSSNGTTTLPEAIGALPYSDHYQVSVLTYLYKKVKGSEGTRQIMPGDAEWRLCETHLRNTGMEILYDEN